MCLLAMSVRWSRIAAFKLVWTRQPPMLALFTFRCGKLKIFGNSQLTGRQWEITTFFVQILIVKGFLCQSVCFIV